MRPKLLKNIFYEHFEVFFMIIKFGFKIAFIMSEPHHVKFLSLQTSSLVQLFDFLTSDKWLVIHLLSIFSESIQWIYLVNNFFK